MKRRIVRNGLLALALAVTAAVMLPAQKAEARDPQCDYLLEQWALCVSSGGGEVCDNFYWTYVVPACS